jgi:thiamine-monophosphate kinase
VRHQILTEDRLIRTIQQVTRRRGRVRLGIGDDAAILHDGTVVTTDAYAEGVHFDLSYMTPRQVGERCACGAISDVVAMAAEPEALFVSLALPGSGPTKRLAADMRELYRGIEAVCSDMGCEVAGGDIIVADRLLLALTVTGTARTPRLRSGARPGDKLYVTGFLGSAEAGRMVLVARTRDRRRRPRWAKSDWRWPLVRRHLRPLPRLAAMQGLKASMHALIDTSDGIATDARHLSEMSRVKIVLEADALPIEAATRRFCVERGLDPLSFVLAAGEDYELLFTAGPGASAEVKGVAVTAVGVVEAGRGLWIRHRGKTSRVTISGYDHLTRR